MPHPIVAEDLERVLVTDLPWEQLHGKAVLVTGANGFLPAYMVRTLVALNRRDPAADIRITALCRSEQRAMARFGQEVERGELTLLIQDVCDPVELDGDLDIIIHAASNASPRYYDTDPIGTLSANVFGTAGLLRLAADRQIDCFFFFSSPDVYGEVSSFPISEGDYGVADPLALRRCYGESKRMAENMLVSWHHQHGVPFKLVRPFHVYGPGFALDDGRVFADFVGDVVAGRDIVLNSDGLARRTFCYLSDATTAFFTSATKDFS